MQVFERRSTGMGIAAAQSSICRPQRSNWQHQRQQRKDMPQVQLAPGQLGPHQIEHAAGIDSDIGVSAADSREGACRLCSDVGQRILDGHQQSIGDDLRSADR